MSDWQDLLFINDREKRDIMIDFDKSKGSYLYDQNRQKPLLDAFNFWSSLPLGYQHEIFKSQDYLEESRIAAEYKLPSGQVNSKLFKSFVEDFHSHCGKDYFSKYYFIHGGALGVDAAVKVAFDYKKAINEKKGLSVKAEDYFFISFKNSFHGVTGFSLSLTDVPPVKIDGFAKSDWPRFEGPSIKFPLDEKEESRLEELEASIEKKIKEEIEAKGPKHAAGIMIEPIQGGGGDHHFRESFFKILRQICDEYEMPLIFDEVQTGFGTCGRLWYYEYLNVKPDILIFGKKSQISGIAVPSHIAEIARTFHIPGRLTVTWNGNPIDWVRCKYILKAYEKWKLVENAEKQGEKILSGMRALGKIHNVRGKGLFIACNFESGQARDEFMIKSLENGLLANKNGPDRVRFRFQMAINDKETEHFLELMEKTLQEISL